MLHCFVIRRTMKQAFCSNNFNRNDLTILFKIGLPRAINKFSLIDILQL